uniref:Uncharacterized protein n=1 Tax=Setaria italica TaxID=4555 RepID=K3Z1Z8_SETIT
MIQLYVMISGMYLCSNICSTTLIARLTKPF